jgi:antitoxin (DNA-binding transcriptional repressor) of toxin-antitoxin stability system
VHVVDINALRLSRLVDRVAAGEEIVLAQGRQAPGLPAAVRGAEAGLMKREIWVADGFEDPLPEKIMAAFRGERA